MDGHRLAFTGRFGYRSCMRSLLPADEIIVFVVFYLVIVMLMMGCCFLIGFSLVRNLVSDFRFLIINILRRNKLRYLEPWIPWIVGPPN
jgi:uncharacterized membrane protein YjgN (DUF898 family)